MQPSKFNVRVYGLLINNQQQLLLADELIRGEFITKFPGGGLELGEGLREGLKREFQEECGIDVTVLDHFYTCDFYVPSANDQSQVISVYYRCAFEDWQQIKTSHKKFDFEIIEGKDAESFRWVSLSNLHLETNITLPIDKVVSEQLMQNLPK
jgi:ADP-ribose pyrophosphatase YjhB (NUDIX family)